jgi:hypothetical protein
MFFSLVHEQFAILKSMFAKAVEIFSPPRPSHIHLMNTKPLNDYNESFQFWKDKYKAKQVIVWFRAQLSIVFFTFKPLPSTTTLS